MKTELITNSELKEIDSYGTEDFPVRFYLDDSETFTDRTVADHWHHEAEILLIREGCAEYTVAGHKIILRKGMGMFINGTVLHGYKALERTLVDNIVFSPALFAGTRPGIYRKFLEPILTSPAAAVIFSDDSPWQKQIIGLLHFLFYLSASDMPAKELDIYLNLWQIWRLLYLNIDEWQCCEIKKIKITAQSRMQLMLEYIAKNSAETVTLEDIAKAAGISKNQALRHFRSELGVSPIQYVIHYRLNKARELLLQTSCSITEVSAASGFESVSYFNRRFKEFFGLTPKQLRRSSQFSRL